MRVVLDQVFTSQSLAATVASESIDTTSMFMVGLYASWTGTPDGSLSFQGSFNNTTWFNLGTPVSTGSVAGTTVMEFPDFMWPYCRVNYVRVASTGTINAWINSKGV